MTYSHLKRAEVRSGSRCDSRLSTDSSKYRSWLHRLKPARRSRGRAASHLRKYIIHLYEVLLFTGKIQTAVLWSNPPPPARPSTPPAPPGLSAPECLFSKAAPGLFEGRDGQKNREERRSRKASFSSSSSSLSLSPPDKVNQ